MESKNQNREQAPVQGPEQVRGAALRKKMEESEAKGKAFRAEHQGADITPDTLSDDAEEKVDDDESNSFKQ